MKRSGLFILAAIAAAACLPGASPGVQAAEGPLLSDWTDRSTLAGNPVMPPMPTPRYNVAAVVVFDHLVVIGGQTGPGPETIVGTVEAYRSPLSGQSPRNIWIGDTSTGGIHQPMPAPRAGASAAVVPDPYDTLRRYIVVVGGIGPDVFDEDGDGNSTEVIASKAVQVYDFFNRTWDVLKPKKGIPGWGAALVRVPEPFTDQNNDGEWNVGEPFTDQNGNGTWDAYLHVMNGVCTLDPAGCTFPGNIAYEVYYNGRRDNPATGQVNEFIAPVWQDPGVSSPVPERESAGVLTRPLAAQDTSPRFIYKFGGGTGGVVATQTAYRRDADTAFAQFEEIKAMPSARVGHVAVVLQGIGQNGYALQYPAVIGGSPDGSTPTDTVYIYHPDAQGWTLASRMIVNGESRPRTGRFAAGIIGNELYVCGGLGAGGVVDGSLVRATLIRTNTPPPPLPDNPLVGNWENMQQSIPTWRTRVAYAQLGSKLYVFGGEDGSKDSIWRDSLSDAVEVYDMAANSWSTNETPMPVNFARGVAAVLRDAQGRDKIYVVGGRIDPEKRPSWPYGNVEGSIDRVPPSGNVYVYDPVAKTWSTAAPMPTPRAFAGHFVYQNRLHVVGGVMADPENPGREIVSPAHEVYDPVTNSWTTHPSGTPFGARQGAATALADHGPNGVWAYWFGGSTNTTQTANCARLNLSIPGSSWEQIPNLPVGGVSGARAITIVDGTDHIPAVFGGDFGPVPCAYDKVFHYFSPFYGDPALANTWVPDPVMEVPGEGKVVRSGFAIGQWGGYVYLAGGDAGPCDLVNRTVRAQILSSAVVKAPGIGQAKTVSDGTKVEITGEKVVTLSPIGEPGFFYMQDPDGTAGIRVETAGALPPLGASVLVSGRMGTASSGERVIREATVTIKGAGTTPVRNITQRSAGGAGYVGPDGLPLTLGTSTEGLLMRVAGKVTDVDFFEGAFWLDDGSGVDSGRPVKGIKVIRTETFPFVGQYLIVTGVVTCEVVDGKKIRVLRGREGQVPGDIQPVF